MTDTAGRNHPQRPPDWREAIESALRAAPAPTPELCQHVAGLLSAGLVGE